MNDKTATVIGGAGFVGRALTRKLLRAGYRVRVGTRRPDRLRAIRKLGPPGHVVPVYAAVDDGPTLDAAFAGADLAVNLVSILTEQGRASFQAINAVGAATCARHAARAGIGRYVQVSAIGAAADAPSAYGRSKADGEVMVRSYIPQAEIIRPSVIFGPEDRFLNMFALMARFSPFLPVFCGHTRFQPVFVDDVADAIVALARAPGQEGDAAPRPVEAGGADILTMAALMAFVLRTTGRARALVPVPMPIATLQADILQRLSGRPATPRCLARASPADRA